MATQILNNGNSVCIVKDGAIRLVLKSQIKEVNVAKGGMVKIEACGCSTPCFYIRQKEVTIPVTTSAEELRDAILAMLPTTTPSGQIAGGATEAKQDDQLVHLDSIASSVRTGLPRVIQLNLAGKATQDMQEEQFAELVNINAGVRVTLPQMIQNALSGKATEAKQDKQSSELQAINTAIAENGSSILSALTDKALASNQDKQLAELQDINEAVKHGLPQVIQDQLTGKATETKQDEMLVKLQGIISGIDSLGVGLTVSIPDAATATNQIVHSEKLQAIKTALDSLGAGINVTIQDAATATKQDDQLIQLQSIRSALENLNGIRPQDCRFTEPLRIDRSQGSTIYKGFADPGSKTDEAKWAVQRIDTDEQDNTAVLWAGGKMDFDQIWNSRTDLQYS